MGTVEQFMENLREALASGPVTPASIEMQKILAALEERDRFREALRNIAAITTAEGTEAEDLAAQIQGVVRETLKEGT